MFGEDQVDVLISQDEIAQRVRELGAEITRDYAGQDLVLVGVLRGAFIFLADLVRYIKMPVLVDFVTLSSYGSSTESSGSVEVCRGLGIDIANRHVLLVEDIVDTGYTIANSGILEDFRRRHALSVRTCALLDKPSRRKVCVAVDYFGFEVPDKFVVGYGLDVDGRHRNLPYIGIVREMADTQQ